MFPKKQLDLVSFIITKKTHVFSNNTYVYKSIMLEK